MLADEIASELTGWGSIKEQRRGRERERWSDEVGSCPRVRRPSIWIGKKEEKARTKDIELFRVRTSSIVKLMILC